MGKLFLILFIAIGLLNAVDLNEKIKNLVGDKSYHTHQRLIRTLFNKTDDFLYKEKINYLKVFKVLRQNGLLNLKLKYPQNIQLTFECSGNSTMAYKILQSTIQSLGYRHILTKSLQYTTNQTFVWSIEFKTEYMLDSYLFLKELRKNNVIVDDISQEDKYHWIYKINMKNPILKTALKVPSHEKIFFNKPLKPIFITLQKSINIEVKSRYLNRWYPYIVFYDSELNVLNSYKQDSVAKSVVINTPQNCKYIIITDMYNLINIKRGLTLIVR